MKKLIAIIKIHWYYHKSEKALDKRTEAFKRKDFAAVGRFYEIHKEYEKKAKACDWTKSIPQ